MRFCTEVFRMYDEKMARIRALAHLLDTSDDDSDLDDIASGLLALNKRKKRILHPKHVENFTEEEIRTMCRVRKDDIGRLRLALRLPDRIHTEAKYTIAGDDALMVTLRRLAYPCRLCDLEATFGLSQAKLSIVINTVVQLVYDRWNHLLGFHQSRFGPDKLKLYARAISDAGSPLQRCVGFIDGTVRAISRPVRNQRAVFSGHKRVHALKFQAVVTPDGLVSHLAGPFTGNRHDTAILVASGLLDQFRNGLRDEDGPFCVYGDAGYPTSPHLQSPFKGARLSAEEVQFNNEMSRVRIAVEWGFGHVLQYFSFVDFKKNMKLLLQPVGTLYTVSVLFSNCRVCMYGNATSTKFNLRPPELHDYLQPVA